MSWYLDCCGGRKYYSIGALPWGLELSLWGPILLDLLHPSFSTLLGRSHAVGTGWASWSLHVPWGLFNWKVGKEETTCLMVVWRPVPLKDLSSNFWRAFSPK